MTDELSRNLRGVFMNMKSIAKLAGVSLSTVSKAFSGSAEISEKTRQRIFDIAKQQGLFDAYNKNKFHKKVIGVICPEVTSDYYNTFLTFLNREIEAHNCIMNLSISNFQEERVEELYSYYSAYCNVDGIIIFSSRGDLKNPLLVPSVNLGPGKSYEGFDQISFDLYSSLEKAIFLLKELGHKKIAFCGEGLTANRLSDFESAMRKAGLPIHDKWVRTSAKRFEAAGEEIVQAWLAEGELPTAIIAAYDYIAIGMIKTLKENGIRIPEEISIIGIDNIPLAPYLEKSLSSIRTHVEDACQKAVEIIIKKIDNQYYGIRQNIIIPTELIIRDSIGPAPN